MKKSRVLILLFGLALSGCGFHLKYNTDVAAQFKIMRFASSDLYGGLSRSLYEQLSDNKVTLVTDESTHTYPLLKIISSSLTKNTISIYQDGKAAEKRLVLNVSAQLIITGQKVYPMNIRVSRSFFDNPGTALAKTTEQELIEREMYNDAAVQIIAKLKNATSNR